jgi:voltage-gated sodium channel
MLTVFKDLWIIVASFAECLTPLLWTVVFIMIILFIFGLFGLEFIGLNSEFDDMEVQERFGRPVDSMLSLFQLMSLDGWMDLVKPFFVRAPWTYLYFILFIGLGPLALMNLVTAVVVESSVKKVREDREYAQQVFAKDVQQRSDEIRDFWTALQGDKIRELKEAANETDSEDGEYQPFEIDKVEFLNKVMKHNFF